MISLQRVNKICKNKSIVLVGNGACLLNRNLGKTIDSYDLVCRMNYGAANIEEYKADVGKRTDIWICAYGNMKKQLGTYKNINPKIILRFNNNKLAKALEPKTYLWCKDATKINLSDLIELVGYNKPTTGTTAVYFFNELIKPKSITIVGYDFFQTGAYYDPSTNISKRWHDMDKESNFVTEYITKNNINKL